MRANSVEAALVGLIDAKRRSRKKIKAETLDEKKKRVEKDVSVKLVDHPDFISFCEQFKFNNRNSALHENVALKCFAVWLLDRVS